MTWTGGALAAVVLAATQSGISTAADPVADTPAATSAADVSAVTPAADAPAPQSRQLTLVTGDVVTVGPADSPDGTPAIDVAPARGREGVGFLRTRTNDGDLRVIPTDVAPLVASGEVDGLLFDIAELERTRAGSLPLIIRHSGSQLPSAARAEVDKEDAVSLESIDSTAVTVQAKDTADLWKSLTTDRAGLRTSVKNIWLDRPVEATAATEEPETTPDGDIAVSDLLGQINAKGPKSRGLDGNGVKVAVLDTGVLASHPDLKDRVSKSANFIPWETDADDHDGHGTHVAGIVAGSGAASGGKYEGVAPGADLISGRVLSGSLGQLSSIIDGMEWAADEGADIVNMSLGSSAVTDGTDPWSLATDALLDQGVLPVVSAGNSGPGSYTVTPPAAADGALAVGAAQGDDAIASFSSRGPLYGDLGVKPNIKAPGVAVTAARAKGTQIGDAEREGPDGPVDDNYTRLSGTSMAAPAVTGAAALVMQAHPDWTPQQVGAALVSSARPSADESVYDQGAGLIDVERAVGQQVVPTANTVDFGRLSWPRSTDPITRKATFRNTSDAPVTLDLALETKVTRGKLSTGLLGLSTDRLTVPAHGEASAEVVLHDDGTTQSGTLSAQIVATAQNVTAQNVTAQDVEVRLPVGLTLEPESHELTVHLLDQKGEGANSVSLLSVLPLDRTLEPFESPIRVTDDATLTVRVPAGKYGISAIISRHEPTSYWYDSDNVLAGEPYVEVTGDTSLTLGGTAATRLGNTVDNPDAQRVYQESGLKQQQKRGIDGTSPLSTDISVQYGHRAPAYWTVPSKTKAKGSTYTTYYREDLAAGFTYDEDSYYSLPTATGPVYYLANSHTGGIPARLTGRVRDRDLARTDARYASSEATTDYNGQSPLKSKLVTATVDGIQTEGRRINVKSPGTRTEFHTAAPGVAWVQELRQYRQNYEGDRPLTANALVNDPEVFRRGVRREEDWNYPAGGPALSADGRQLIRSGDTLTADLPLFADSEPAHRAMGDRSMADSLDYTLTDADGTTVPKSFDGAEQLPRAPWANAWQLPSGPHTYTLKAHVVRNLWYTLATEVEASWTFRSAASGTSATSQVPLTSVRWQPEVDEQSRAEAGRRALVPFTVQRTGEDRGRIRQLTVEASFDGGLTWEKAPVALHGERGTAVVRHPELTDLPADAVDKNGNGYVSLRVRGADRVSTFALTVKKAYKLK